MFQLVVAVIAIALFAIMALVGMFYGGDTFRLASERAIYTAYGNEAIQIREAIRLYSVENIVQMDQFHDVSSLDRSEDYNFSSLAAKKYLKDLSLKNQGWIIDKGVVRKPLEQVAGTMTESTQLQRCRNFNTFSRKDIAAPGIDNGCPLCDDARYTDYPACWIQGN